MTTEATIVTEYAAAQSNQAAAWSALCDAEAPAVRALDAGDGAAWGAMQPAIRPARAAYDVAVWQAALVRWRLAQYRIAARVATRDDRMARHPGACPR